MSQLEVDKIIPQSGTTLTIGDSGDTVNFADGTSIGIDTNTLYIDSTNNRVGIGTSSPDEKLTVSGDMNVVSGSTYKIKAQVSSSYALNLGHDRMQIVNAAANPFLFYYGSTEKLRIDSPGNVMVGTTDSLPGVGNTTLGVSLRNNNGGSIVASRGGDRAGYFNRNTSDGDIVQFRKDGTAIGSIGVTSTDNVFLSGNSTHAGIMAGTSAISPFKNGVLVDNGIDFGSNGFRWKDIYLGGGAFLGGTGTANKLDDYEEGTWTPNVGGNATYTVQTGNYIKIGKLVYVTGIIQINNLGTGSNTTIVGLPFSGDSSNPYNGSVGYFSSLASSIVNITPYNQLGNTNINFRTLTSASNSSGTSNTIFQNGTRVDFSLTYTTA